MAYQLAGTATERKPDKTAGPGRMSLGQIAKRFILQGGRGRPSRGKHCFVLTFSLVRFFWVKPKEMNITRGSVLHRRLFRGMRFYNYKIEKSKATPYWSLIGICYLWFCNLKIPMVRVSWRGTCAKSTTSSGIDIVGQPWTSYQHDKLIDAPG